MKITFEDYKKIQELKRQGFTANQATKKLPYTQYKIYKYWDMAEEDFFEETNADNSPCSVYREFLMEEIRKNNNAGARILYDKVFEEFGEVKVSLASLFRYVKGLRRRMGLSEKIVRVKQAVEMQPQGLEAQVDFGQAKMLNMYGLPVKVYFFCMVLSYSRMKFVYFSPDPFDALHTAYAHEKAFKYYGGRPKQILYDQDRTIVSSENAGNIIFTKDFDGYVKAAGFDAIVCKPYSPDTKGKVETVVKTVKEYFLEGREYCGIDRLNSDCLAWLDRTGNNLAIQALRKSPRELFEREKGELIKHKPIEIDIYRNRIAVVISPFIVRYKGNRYSVPPSRCNEGDKVRIEEEENALHIINLQTGEKIITHKLELQKGKSVVRREVSTVDYLKTAKRRYEHSDVMTNFLERIEITKPRYLKEQAGLLRRIEKEYTQSEILNAVIKCAKDDRYCMTEVLSELLIHLGERNLEEIAPKGAISKKFKADFDAWLKVLEDLGYTNYWQILNAKDYGIPQNRERVFCVSIRGEHKPFAFPEKQELTLRLRDMIDPVVEERFYLKESTIRSILRSTFNQRRDSIRPPEGLANTLCARDWRGPQCVQIGEIVGEKYDKMHDISKRVYEPSGIAPTVHCQQGGNTELKIAENFVLGGLQKHQVPRIDGVSPTLTEAMGKGGGQTPVIIDTESVKEERFFKQAVETMLENDVEVGDTVDAFNKRVNKSGVCPTITTRPEGFKTAILPVVKDEREDPVIVAMRGRNPDNPSDRTAGKPTEQRLEANGKGVCNTLTSVQKDNLVLEKTDYVARCYGEFVEKKGYIPEMFVAYNRREITDLAPTLTAHCCSASGSSAVLMMENERKPVVEVKVATKQGYEEATEGDYINITYPGSTTKRGRVGKGVAHTITCGDGNAVITENVRIRKLTPRECLRLMGWKDEQIDKIQATKMSGMKTKTVFVIT